MLALISHSCTDIRHVAKSDKIKKKNNNLLIRILSLGISLENFVAGLAKITSQIACTMTLCSTSNTISGIIHIYSTNTKIGHCEFTGPQVHIKCAIWDNVYNFTFITHPVRMSIEVTGRERKLIITMPIY